MKSTIPNCITLFRILGTVALLFTVPLTVTFYIIYTFCGITDVLDGFIARTTKSTSEFGAKLDSIADILFYGVMLIKIFPVLLRVMPVDIWYIVGAVLLIRLTAYAVAAVKYHRFAALHTILNKLTGLLVFTVPYIMGFSAASPIFFSIAGIAGLAALEELVIHISCSEYRADVHTVVHKNRTENTYGNREINK